MYLYTRMNFLPHPGAEQSPDLILIPQKTGEVCDQVSFSIYQRPNVKQQELPGYFGVFVLSR